MPFIYPHETGEGALRLPEDILAVWRRLAISDNPADPFCSGPDWSMIFHELAHPRSPVFYQASGNGVVFLREYALTPTEFALCPLEDSWQFGQTLLGPDSLGLLGEALCFFQKKYYPRFPDILFSGIQENGRQSHSLYFAFSRFFQFYRVYSATQCAASLAGGLDGWLSRRSANHRAKLRKAARKCREAGVIFERFRPETPEKADEIYRRILAVESKSWKGIGQCGMDQPFSREFYGLMLRRLALEKSAYIIMASQNGVDIGFIFGVALGPFYRGQQFSYAQTHKDLSLGNVLQLQKVRWLCELGFARYDMGPATGPRMEYKKRWAELEYPINSWLMRLNK